MLLHLMAAPDSETVANSDLGPPAVATA